MKVLYQLLEHKAKETKLESFSIYDSVGEGSYPERVKQTLRGATNFIAAQFNAVKKKKSGFYGFSCDTTRNTIFIFISPVNDKYRLYAAIRNSELGQNAFSE